MLPDSFVVLQHGWMDMDRIWRGGEHYIKFSKTENVHIKGGARECCNVVRFLDANMTSDTLLIRADVGRLNRYF